MSPPFPHHTSVLLFFLMIRPPPRSPLFPSPTLFRSQSLRSPHPPFRHPHPGRTMRSQAPCADAFVSEKTDQPAHDSPHDRHSPSPCRRGHQHGSEIGRAHV